METTLNPPYTAWRTEFPALQAGVLAAAHDGDHVRQR